MSTTSSQVNLNWDKGDGILPAIVQHADTGSVLMLAYMNAEALQRTIETGRVTFWSRSKQRLWMKGETSGHTLELAGFAADCDGDTLLVLARPAGPVCHLGTPTCFGADPPRAEAEFAGFLVRLQRLIAARIANPRPGSYTAKLVSEGAVRVAQKVGEEGVELALAGAVQSNREVITEAADLLYHMLLLLELRGIPLSDVSAELVRRHAEKTGR